MAKQEKRRFKSTKKVSGGPKLFRKWADWKDGDVLIAKLLGWHTDQYDKECPVVHVEDAMFKDKSGPKFVGKDMILNAAGMLNKAVKQMEEGQLFQLTYTGTSLMESGKYAGKESHTMQIELVEEEGAEEEEEVDHEEDEDSDYEDEDEEGYDL